MPKNSGFRVSNEFSQTEKRQVLRNDRLVEPTTYHQFAVNDAELGGGRFAQINKSSVIGATHQYPAQPSTSPWASDPVGVEPPLGQDVNAVEPVGTYPEIMASLGESIGAVGMNANNPSPDSPIDGAAPSDRSSPNRPLSRPRRSRSKRGKR